MKKGCLLYTSSIEKNKAKMEAKVNALLKAAESVLAEENEECSAEEPSMEDLSLIHIYLIF